MSIDNKDEKIWRHSQRIFVEMLQGKTEDEILRESRRFLPQFVIENSDTFFGISTADILSGEKGKGISHPRGEIVYLLAEKLKKTLAEIGKKIGDRDHTTILSYIKGVRAQNNGYKSVTELEQLWTEIEEAYNNYVRETNYFLVNGLIDENAWELTSQELN